MVNMIIFLLSGWIFNSDLHVQEEKLQIYVYEGNRNQKDNTIAVNKKIKEILSNAPTIDISTMTFEFDSISEIKKNLIDDEKNIADFASFISIYQLDSLINKSVYNLDSPVYILGKDSKTNYDMLIVIRYYETWFATIDMLTYNKKGELKGFLILAGYGGDMNYAYDSGGYFDNNIYIYTAESKDVEGEYNEAIYVNCIRTNAKYLIHDNGEISLIEKESVRFDCPVLYHFAPTQK